MVMFTKEAENPKKWSAETPYLYTLLISLKNRFGGTVEALGCKVGFRSVEIKNKQLHINGVPVYLKGVNVHEHHERKGERYKADEKVKHKRCQNISLSTASGLVQTVR